MKKHRRMWLWVGLSLLLAACSSSSTPEMPTITTQAVNVEYELEASFAAYQRGDINRDGRVTTADLRILSGVIASGDVSGLDDYRRYQADFTCDGVLDVEDIREIQERAANAKDPAEVQICPTEFEVEDGEFIVLISNIGDLPFNGLQILASAGLDVSLIPTIYRTATPTTFVYNIEVAEGVTEGSLSIDGAGLAEVEFDLEFEIALGNIAEIVASRPELSVLLDAVLAAGLADALSGDTELTVFAPDNEAFLDLLEDLELDSLEALITAVGLPFVTEVLSFHVVPGIFTAADLINLINANGGQFIELETLTGGTVTVGLDEGDVILQNFAEVIEANIEASNGIIHVIDAVLDFADDTNKDGTIGVVDMVMGQITTTDQYFFTEDSVRDYFDFFTVVGTEPGQTVAVTLESTEFSPLLRVVSSAGFEEFSEDDAISFTVVADELFFIQVFSVLDGGLGAYTLTTVLADEPPPPTIAEIAVGEEDLTSLVENLNADQVNLLSDATQDLAVFAPVNSAFEAAAGLLATLSAEEIAEIINYHVIAESFSAVELIPLDGQMIPGTDIMVSIVDGNVFVQGSGNDAPIQVIAADITASNGIIHKINGILLPLDEPTIAEVAAGDAELSSLVENLSDDQLALLSDEDEELTVLAPVNSAFEAATDLLATLTADEIEEIINYHVLAAIYLAEDVIALDGQTLPGTDIAVSVVDGSVFLQGSANTTPVEVIATDTLASNGVIHKLAGILLPADTVADVAAADAELTALVDALNEDQLELLSDRTADLTVLAPVNSAFEAATDLLATLTAEEIAEIINYHVLAVRYLAADVIGLDGQTIPGTDIAVSVVNGSVFLQGAGNDTPIEVIETDILAGNGVIHKLDGILLP